MKNKCKKCKYLIKDCSPEGDYDIYCEVDPNKYLDLDYDVGCNYSEDTLKLLNKYRDFLYSQLYSYRFVEESEKLENLKKELKQKQENNEKIDYWDIKKVDDYQQHYNMLLKMEIDHERCEYLRFFKENDPKGILKKILKKKGEYPCRLLDLFYGIEKEKTNE